MAPLLDFLLRESRRERDTETDQNVGTFRGTECSNPPPSSTEVEVRTSPSSSLIATFYLAPRGREELSRFCPTNVPRLTPPGQAKRPPPVWVTNWLSMSNFAILS